MDSATFPDSRPVDGPRAAKAVLVPVDGSVLAARAAEVGLILARRLDVPLRYLAAADSSANAMMLRVRMGAQLRTRRLPPAVPIVVTEPDAARAIAEVADELPAVVCMATHGRGRVRGAIAGSVAEAVLRRLPAPVLLTGPEFDPARHADPVRIVACVDGSPESEAILPVAVRWARDLHLALELVTVLHPQLSRQLITLPPQDDLLEDMQLHRLADRLRRDSGQDVQWETLHGTDPVPAIVHYATSRPGTLLALTTHGRSGLSRAVMGSVAARLAHTSPTPLLVRGPSAAAPA